MNMNYIFGASASDATLEKARSILDQVTSTFFNFRSFFTLVIALTVAMILGRIIAAILRRFARAVSRTADKVQDLKEVNRLRRIETLIVLAVALVRMILVIAALYFWWIFAHPGQQLGGLIGVSTLAVIIGGATVQPILRDLAYGSVMMAEHWYGVGDYVQIDPLWDMKGVVERVTLRSTRIRGLNGEVVWVNNQNIQAVRVLPKSVRTVAVEIFVSDLTEGLNMIEQTNLRLPTGPLMVVRPLHIMSKIEVSENLWHITAIGETAPGREWLLQEYAKEIMQQLDDDDHPIMKTEPIAHDADSDAERRFARTVQNARKSPLQRKRLPLPESLAKQIEKPVIKSAKKVTKVTKESVARRHKKPKKIQ
jgi:moderate conductance mechanosensitive channel